MGDSYRARKNKLKRAMKVSKQTLRAFKPVKGGASRHHGAYCSEGREEIPLRSFVPVRLTEVGPLNDRLVGPLSARLTDGKKSLIMLKMLYNMQKIHSLLSALRGILHFANAHSSAKKRPLYGRHREYCG